MAVDTGSNFREVVDLLYAAKQAGLEVVLNNDQLQVKLLHNDKPDEALLHQIKANKQRLIDYLNNNAWRSKTVQQNHKKINRFDKTSVSRLPLSFSQERLWFIDRLEGSVQYHRPDVLRLKGRVNREALEKAFQTIVNRHEVLRTVIREHEGTPYQEIKAENGWKLHFVEGSAYSGDEEGLRKYIDTLIDAPFDLSKDDMLRVHLLSLREEEHMLVITLHHIASDGWSIPILIKELSSLYESYVSGKAIELPHLPLQFADYALWQRQYLQGEVLENKLSYWKEKLEGVSPLQLPTDYPRPSVQGTKGSSAYFTISKEVSEGLQQLSRQYGTTSFMTLLSAFKVLLYRYSGQDDICVGTSIADRQQEEIEHLIGFFVNTLALRSTVRGEASFADLLQQVRATTLEAYEHQEVPFEKVVEAVSRQRDMSRNPLFQVMLVLQNTPEVPQLQLGELLLSQEELVHDTAKFDITFFINETPQGLQGAIEYSTDLYSSSTIERMVGHFEELLRSIVKDPKQSIGRLSLLSASEVKELESFNATSVEYPRDKTIADLFEEQARKSPESVAVVFEGSEWSYRELDERSNRIAHHLRSLGVVEETLVPVCIERSGLMIAAILGILKAGGAYVPIDPEYPKERISYMLSDSEARVVVSSKGVRDRLPSSGGFTVMELSEDWFVMNSHPVTKLAVQGAPHHLAYVIYTSGSTGKPKGVMIEHVNLVDYVFGLQQSVGIQECRSFALVSSIATDLGNTVLYSSLLVGGALHLFSKDSINDADALQHYFRVEGVECLKIVPSHWKALSAHGSLLLPSRMLIFGGEALHSELVAGIRESGSGCKVINHYGPTETTIGKLLHVVEEERQYGTTIPIGKPFSNTEAYVVTKDLSLCPVGVPGELCIGGDGVARGYRNNEELTRSKFIANPFGDGKAPVLYRTGDLVRYLPDGNIEFIGRIDEQIKIRGYRVELGEIENVVIESGLVRGAVVLAREDKSGTRQLAGYVVSEDYFDREEMVAYLKDKLPDYMVPMVWVELESFPLLANGKIDRKGLPDPDAEQGAAQHIAPRNAMETALVEIWQELLEVDVVGIRDNFFELGGHSLLAIQLISAIRKRLEVEVNIGDVFDYHTIELLVEKFKVETPGNTFSAIKKGVRPSRLPLSFSQERLWFIDRLEGSVQYHRPDVLRLKGRVNREALEKAFQTIVNRHEVLRTVIREHEGTPYQEIKAENGWKLHFVEGSAYSGDEEGLRKYIDTLIDAPFDLSKDDMLRVHLLSLREEEHMLVITLHHIALDGWSIPILIKELSSLYGSYVSGKAIELPHLPLQFADYALWQRQYLQGEVLENKLSYWKEKLEGVSPLQLPTDYPRPSVQGTKGSSAYFTISKEVSEGLQQLSRQYGTTSFMTLLSAFKVLLYRYSGQDDICVGTSIADRQQEEIEHLIGFFVNTLALRSTVRGEASFADLLQQVRATTLEAYEHQEVPFEKVVEAVSRQRDMSRNPLFQVMLVLQNTPEVPELKFGGLTLSKEEFTYDIAKFELTFFLAETPSGLDGAVTYSTDLYSSSTIERMVGHFEELLRSIVKDPKQSIGRLSLLSASEVKELESFNATSVEYPRDKTIADLFEEQARKSPESVAVVFEGSEWSYRELDERSNRIAHHLRSLGVVEETLVPVCIERSGLMIAAILGILKAGGAYVPIDPEYPKDRISYMLSDSEARVVVSSKGVRDRLPSSGGFTVMELSEDWFVMNSHPVTKLAVQGAPHHLAYVIYTSGSTGKPKGVMIEHVNLVDYVFGLQQSVGIQECRSFALVSSIATDLGNTVLYSSLLVGGALHLFSKDSINDADALQHYFRVEGVECLKIVPSHWKALSAHGSLLLPSRMLIFGGEALHSELVAGIRESGSGCKVINHYGPTETTIGKLLHVVEEERQYGTTIPIGKPFSNTEAYVVTKDLSLCPVGVPGELCIGGDGVARGYRNNEELTRSKFIANPFGDGKAPVLYRTGDLVRYLPDGNIEFIGRIDEQIKIRGYRVELGEIENVVIESGLVRGAVVLAREDKSGTRQLAGYVVSEDYFDREEMVAYLKDKLPDYMVPMVWVELESFPLLANGKIDRKGLPDPDAEQGAAQHIAPRNAMETALVEIWQELLEVDVVGIRDNFFELGGHSLLAIQLISAIRKRLEVEVNIGDVFDYPTIELLVEKKNLSEFELLSI